MFLIKKNGYSLVFGLVILLSIFLRFINYQNRWGLAYDQAHDAIVARYALENFLVPLLGPFSSAGPFQTAGTWYGLIMIGTALFPGVVMGPWIFMTFLYVVFVALIVLVGKEMFGKKFGLLAGLFAAVSTAEITQGTNLTNQGPLALISLAAIWCSLLFLKTHQPKHIFLVGLFVGLAASIHLQGIALGSLLIMTLLISRRFDSKTLFLVFLGLCIPWMGVGFYDTQHQFFNSRNMVQYYFHDQYTISLDVLGRRWSTYLGVFWPKMWGFVIGGNQMFGYILIVSIGLVSIWQLVKKKLPPEIILLLTSLLVIIVMLRYTRTPLFESYIVFLHPFILLLSTWVVFQLIQANKLFGLIVTGTIIFFSLQKDYIEISKATNTTAITAHTWQEFLTKKYPEKKLTIYTKISQIRDRSIALTLYLQAMQKNDGKSMAIGVIATDAAYIKEPILYGKNDEIKLIDLHRYSTKEINEARWELLSPEAIYVATESWYNNKKK